MVYNQELQNYMNSLGMSKTYLTNLKYWDKFVLKNNLDITAICPNDLVNFTNYLRTFKLKPGTINMCIKAVRFYYKFLANIMGTVDKSKLVVLKDWALLPTERKIRAHITQEEMQTMLRNGMTYITWVDARKTKALIYFMFFTGVRVAELENMKRVDINLKENWAIVRTPTKNKCERFVFFPDEVANMLRKYFQSEDEEFNVFNMTIKQVEYIVSKLNDYLPRSVRLSPHVFRHSFANMLAEGDVGIKMAQKLLGHKSMNSTLIYYDPEIKVIERTYKNNIKVLPDPKKETTNGQGPDKPVGPSSTI